MDKPSTGLVIDDDRPMTDDALRAALTQITRRSGAVPLELLTQQARRQLRRPTDEDEIAETVYSTLTLVGLPDGSVTHLLHHLDGQVLTTRVRSSTRGRRDLWTSPALLPLSLILFEGPLPLTSGGVLRAAEHLNPALVSDQDWLPVREPGELVGLRITQGQVEPFAVDELTGTPEQYQAIRALLSRHLRRERYFGDPDDEDLAFDLVRALVRALAEDSDLLRVAVPPLDELTHLVHERRDNFRWRDLAAWRGEETVSFGVTGMPVALHNELSQRATTYGMSFDEYVTAVLGHLAWRTPFGEDIGPWEQWEPETEQLADVRELRH